jgi:GNAT superfamily N-acetyltransferase
MTSVTINDESIESSGALSVFHAALDELNRRYGMDDDGPRMALDELGPPLGLFLVARVDGHPAGGVGVRPIGEPGAHLGEVKRLWVRPDLRRGGVATNLMSAIVDRARRLGYERLYLETGPAQPEALAFYAKTGWAPVDDFPSGAFTHHSSHRFTKDL